MNVDVCQNGKDIVISSSQKKIGNPNFVQSKLRGLRMIETSKSVDADTVLLKGMGCKADYQEALGVQPKDCILVSTSTAVVKAESQVFHVISTPGGTRPGKTGKEIRSPWFSFSAPGIYAARPGKGFGGEQKLFQVGKVHACSQWVHVKFHKSFATPPVVIASTQSLTSHFHRMHAKSVEARVARVTAHGFDLALDTISDLPCEDTQEVVGWFAIEESKG